MGEIGNMKQASGETAGNMAASMRTVSVYRYSASYAKEHGEMAEYRASMQMNISCRYAVEKAVNENFDGMRLGQGAAEPVVVEYGAERVAYVLAASVLLKEYDDRFSRENKNWAHTVPIFKDKAFDGQECWPFAAESHPAVLDGFIRLARKAFQTLGKAAGKTASGRKSVLKTLREHQAAQKTADAAGWTAQKVQESRKGEQVL